MPFISYSQNQEDVLLAMALHEVKNGFYVDVGAGHPFIDSVTNHFYKTGWRGINIEPSAVEFELLRKFRPNDINLNLAIGIDTRDSLLHISDRRGRHSLLREYAEHNSVSSQTQYIQQTNLTNVFSSELLPGQEIHFLKVDVEGSELDVIRGMDFEKYRPWIIVIEALHPISLEKNSSAWEKIILDSHYTLSFFDGVNNYYLENSHSHRSKHLRRVNVLLHNHTSAAEAGMTETIKFLEEQEVKKSKLIQDLESKVKVLLQQSALDTKRIEVLLQQSALDTIRIEKLEEVAKKYDMMSRSKTMRYTQKMRRNYGAVRLFFSRPNLRYSIVLKINNYLKKWPRTRRIALKFYFFLKLNKNAKYNKTNPSETLSTLNGPIALANSKSLVRSFKLYAKEF